MKPKALVIAAVAAIPLIACVGFHFATRSFNESGSASPDSLTADASRVPSSAASSRSVVPITKSRSRMAPGSPRSSMEAPQTDNPLGIATTDLLAAQRLANEMAANMDGNLSTMQDPGYGQRSQALENPSRMLGLRLGVDAGTSEKLAEILAADRAGEIDRRIAAEKGRLERTQELLENDRDNYANYLALESMLSRGIPLSEAQEAFYKQFRQSQDPTKASEAGPVNQEWYEKEDVLDAMHQHLSPEQQAELVTFVDEQETRERERQSMHAYMRSSTIADRLGLDEGDRTTLYEYLRENPQASTSEVSSLLAPELRALLPAGL